MKTLWRYLAVAALALLCLAKPSSAQDRLIYCNHPEKIVGAGVLGDARLEPFRTYTVFYHYKNISARTDNFVLGIYGAEGGPLSFTVRQGLADPRRDPPSVGKQAMARLFNSKEKRYAARDGNARFSFRLGRGEVASGVLVITSEQAARLRIYFGNDRKVASGMKTVLVDAPRQDVEIQLGARGDTQRFRIGYAEDGADRTRDGAYGALYAFRIAAPEGSRVRVMFSPRGGKGGIVGALNGALIQTGIVPATRWRKVCETIVGPGGALLTTSPFGGVFYPVELTFQIL